MPDHPHPEATNIIVKGTLYVVGILLGLCAKIAILYKDKPITVKEFLSQGAMAFAAAWLVWSILEHYGYLDLANIASVIVGRYSDYILIAVWRAIKNLINSKQQKP